MLRAVAVGVSQSQQIETGARPSDAADHGGGSDHQLDRRGRGAGAAVGQSSGAGVAGDLIERIADIKAAVFQDAHIRRCCRLVERHRDLIRGRGIAGDVLGIVNDLTDAGADVGRKRGRISIAFAVGDRGYARSRVAPADNHDVQITRGLRVGHVNRQRSRCGAVDTYACLNVVDGPASGHVGESGRAGHVAAVRIGDGHVRCACGQSRSGDRDGPAILHHHIAGRQPSDQHFGAVLKARPGNRGRQSVCGTAGGRYGGKGGRRYVHIGVGRRHGACLSIDIDNGDIAHAHGVSRRFAHDGCAAGEGAIDARQAAGRGAKQGNGAGLEIRSRDGHCRTTRVGARGGRDGSNGGRTGEGHRRSTETNPLHDPGAAAGQAARSVVGTGGLRGVGILDQIAERTGDGAHGKTCPGPQECGDRGARSHDQIGRGGVDGPAVGQDRSAEIA